MTLKEATFKYSLRLGDTGLILSQRLSEWTGHGPFLEEDLALTNIALDILGRANALLKYAGEVEGKGRTEDNLAFMRSEREFYNLLMVEQENGDYGKTMMRQFLIDAFDLPFFTLLADSKDATLAGIAAKTVKEVSYHLRHSSSWIIRFGDGTEESQARVQNALNELWRFTSEFFEMNEVDRVLIEAGVGVDLTRIKPLWEEKVKEVFEKARLKIPENVFMQRGSRDGNHTERLGYILAEMQTLPRSIPGAKW